MTPPRFIPFEAMTEGEQQEHLLRCHRAAVGAIERHGPAVVHAAHHAPEYWGAVSNIVGDHTHDKPLLSQQIEAHRRARGGAGYIEQLRGEAQ